MDLHRSLLLLSYLLLLQTSSQAFTLHHHGVTCTRTKLSAISPVLDEVCDTTGVTLTRFMYEVERVNPELSELAQLFSGIQTASKAITNLVKRSQLPSSSMLGLEGVINVQGEDQKKLDVITNDILKMALRHTGKVGVLASEEEDRPVDVMSMDKEVVYDEGSQYVTVFDPLDGSSNVDAGIPTGTIFGIFHHDETCDITAFLEGDFDEDTDMMCMVNTLQPGNNLAASGYVLYSSSTFLTMTIGHGVYGFTLDEQLGEFILSHPCIEIPETMNIMSFNEANWDLWDAPMQEVHESWRTGKSSLGKRYTSRYVGSMVADVHRTLLYGGVFGYPGDTKNVNGKLRLLYEAAPMSFLIEQAGGLSSTGRERIMDISPENVHQRVPVVMGSKNEVQEVIDGYKKWDAEKET
eukprot:CAMPEP_0197234430 /NCGR_PEP_ID=MMETSP1429-20130617/2183_1 /TAXON_ID=49237 /ORGANISM="Chaetoceros  sp., Strain UNC1202" /LENGTH=407 /DNA_ID=CAMNT_0042692837 /DNA_START=77 /DNA_END=1300 /DNA_ORIENTATION=+